MKNKKKQWLYERMLESGLSTAEAVKYLEFNERCNWEGLIRAWRKQAQEHEKNRTAEKQFQERYSSLEHYKHCIAKAKRKKEEAELNLSMF